MVTRAHFSHKDCHGKNQADMHDMLHSKGINWATDLKPWEKDGTYILPDGSKAYMDPSYYGVDSIIGEQIHRMTLK